MTSEPGNPHEQPNHWTRGGQAKSSDVAMAMSSLKDKFETPKTLISVLEHRPQNRSELLTYVANWKAYADFLLAQAKERQIQPNHPLHSEEGQQKFVAEITRFQGIYSQVEADLRGGRIHLHGDEMRRIGGHFSEANIVIEQAIAVHQMA